MTKKYHYRISHYYFSRYKVLRVVNIDRGYCSLAVTLT